MTAFVRKKQSAELHRKTFAECTGLVDSFCDKKLQAGIDVGGDVADIILQAVRGIAQILFHAAERIDFEDFAENGACDGTEGKVTYVVAYCTPEAFAKTAGNIKGADNIRTVVIASDPITDQKSLSDFMCKLTNRRNICMPTKETCVILSIKPETKYEKEEAA